MLGNLMVHDEQERFRRQGLLRYDVRLQPSLIRAHVPDIASAGNCHATASGSLSGVGVAVTSVSIATGAVAHRAGASRLVDASQRRFTNRRIQSHFGSRRTRERGEPPLLELLGTLPRKVARRLHIYVDRAGRARATLVVIAERPSRARGPPTALLELRFDRLPGFGTSQDRSIDDGHTAMSAIRACSSCHARPGHGSAHPHIVAVPDSVLPPALLSEV
jgi:hypothetical protein